MNSLISDQREGLYIKDTNYAGLACFHRHNGIAPLIPFLKIRVRAVVFIINGRHPVPQAVPRQAGIAAYDLIQAEEAISRKSVRIATNKIREGIDIFFLPYRPGGVDHNLSAMLHSQNISFMSEQVTDGFTVNQLTFNFGDFTDIGR